MIDDRSIQDFMKREQSEDKRQHILAQGAELVHRQGFNNTGLQEILKAAGVPKGSFYFYFANKEAFGIELVDFYESQFRASATPILDDDSLKPLEKMRRIFDLFHDFFEAQGFSRGCPIGNLAQEMSDLSPAFANRLRQSIQGLASFYNTFMKQAQDEGDIRPDLDTAEAACFIVAAWHGSLIRMKVEKNREPLERFLNFVFGTVLT